MSISTIPDPKFVNCNRCRYRTKQKVLKKSGSGKETLYFCSQTTPWRQLYGQKGCDKGEEEQEPSDFDDRMFEEMDELIEEDEFDPNDDEVGWVLEKEKKED